MAIINEETLKEKLEHENNVVNVLHKGLHEGKGRKEGEGNRTVDYRALAGFLAHLEPTREVAANLGMSESAVHNYKHGRNGNGLSNPELKDKVDEKLGAVKNTALTRLLESVGAIDIKDVKKSKTLSGIAKDLAFVVDKTSEKASEAKGVNVIFYSPQIKDEKSYEVIEVESR